MGKSAYLRYTTSYNRTVCISSAEVKTVCFSFSCDEHTGPTYTVTRDAVCSSHENENHTVFHFCTGYTYGIYNAINYCSC